MKREAEIKKLLISNAIRLIAEGGFEKATTKELALSGGDLPDFKMNEVYIYRLFGSKERLYESAFLQLDSELFSVLEKEREAIGDIEMQTRERLYRLFLSVWRFILGNEARCRCYVRYYYSIYFNGESLRSHKQTFGNIVKNMSPLFKEEADVYSIMHGVFVMLFDFCIRVYNGDMEDSEINRFHVFNVLYSMMTAYFKTPDPIA